MRLLSIDETDVIGYRIPRRPVVVVTVGIDCSYGRAVMCSHYACIGVDCSS